MDKAYIMKQASNVFVLCAIVILHCAVPAHPWHGLGNDNFHCWPLNATAAHSTPYTSCPGVDIDWIEEPPDKVKAERAFNVTFHLHVDPAFYQWAVTVGIFDKAGTIGGFSGNASAAQAWCESTACPADPSKANVSNCCIHHVNVHSCPLSETSVVNNGLCGPWIPPQGSIFTHSQVMVGPINSGNWTSVIPGLYEVGLTSVIAHFKIAGMHVAVEKSMEVLPKTVCGNSACETEEGETCSNCPSDCGDCPLENYEIALIAISLLLVLIAVVSVIGYFQYQRRKLLWDESWIVPASAIIESNGDRGQFGSRLSMMTGSAVDLSHSNSVTTMSTAAMKRQHFTTVAFVDGRQVAVNNISNKNFQLSKRIRVEVREVRSLDHPNLCRFMGGCIEPGSVCILFEYCPKGSLLDVLLNDGIPLNWGFRFSLLTDVARAMTYLHRHKIVHGNLKSNNCVVDDRWTCKVTDFGLHEYKRENKTLDPDLAAEQSQKKERDRIYRAPETRSSSSTGIPPSDVYSFAIILVEAANRDDAYGDNDVVSVPEGWKPPLPQHELDTQNEDPDFVCPSPVEYTKLIQQCWADKAEERPTFDSVKKTLQRINPNKLSAVDTMMAMMEKYSKHLESIVDERTQQLVEEKQRTDTLLYSMMPRKIADHLKTGHLVMAEWFDACTIYFSDIVGFTDISGRSSPLQVVDLLNKLYCHFDCIIEKYDVYKVETIGDAYMVVSGVPEVTEHHARHVALMSLEMVAASKEFVIPHMPTEPLKIRVGLHSGPVCAGVVGIKMPRYCLFGDTVNTASRMESNGEAYKIHISNTTFIELQKCGHFVCDARGAIPVKGKGEMFTWWLVKANESVNEKNTATDDNQNTTPHPPKEKKGVHIDQMIEELILNPDSNLLSKDFESLLQ
ncbi:atrial natriuretic peptide receptor 1-like [Littorina saxatilis]|uniref:atrial natriuretic peptide receptor 1-like n=1 Tax=Littorina saxatilis TaxID=31220 RepID=UPI0038B47B12